MVIRSVEYAGTRSVSKCYGAYKGFYSLDRLIAVLWTLSPSHKSVLSASPVLPGGQWRRASETCLREEKQAYMKNLTGNHNWK